MKKAFRLVTLVSALSLLYSCAYLFNKKETEVVIRSNPPGAYIIIDGRNYGPTPAYVSLVPKNYLVTLIRDNYGWAQFNLETGRLIRRKDGDGLRCVADVFGSILILPIFSFMSVYCRDFKQSEYSINIPYRPINIGNIYNRRYKGAYRPSYQRPYRDPYYTEPPKQFWRDPNQAY